MSIVIYYVCMSTVIFRQMEQRSIIGMPLIQQSIENYIKIYINEDVLTVKMTNDAYIGPRIFNLTHL